MYTVQHKTYRKTILSETLLHSFTCHCYQFLPADLAICLILLQTIYSRSEKSCVMKYKAISYQTHLSLSSLNPVDHTNCIQILQCELYTKDMQDRM